MSRIQIAKSCCLLVALSLLLAGAASAATPTITWDGNGWVNDSGNWSEPLNWDLDRVPNETDVVLLPTVTVARTVTVDVPVTIAELQLQQTSGNDMNRLQVNEDMTAGKLTLDPSGGTFDGKRLWYKINVAADKTFRAGADATASFYFPVLGGSGTVVKEGTGSAFLNHAGATFTFPGTFTVAGGVVNLCYDETVGTYRVLDGGTLDVGAAAQWNGSSKLNGSGYNGQGAVYFSQSNGLWPTATFSKPITLETTSTFNVDGARTITLSGAIDGEGGLTKIGGGKLYLVGNCSYSGETTVDSGTLEVTSVVPNTHVTVNGGKLIGAPVLFPMGVTVNDPGVWDQSWPTWWCDGDPNADGNWSTAENWTTLAVPGEGDTAILPAPNRLRIVTVDQPLILGELIMRSTGTVNTLQVNEDMTTGKLTLDPSGGTFDDKRLWYKINVAADKTFRAGADATASFYFPVLGGSGTVTKEGTGTAFLHHLGAGAAFTFPGTFTVAGGVVNLCYDETVGTYHVLDGGTLDVGAAAQWNGSSRLNGSGHNGQGAVYFSQRNGLWATATFGKPITLETTSAFNVDAARTITLSGAIDGEGGLTKIGGGKLYLVGNCSYSGETTVDSGTLEVTSVVPNTHVTVNGGKLIGAPVLFPMGVTVNDPGVWDQSWPTWWCDGDPNADGNWSTAENWTTLAVPGEGDTAILPAPNRLRIVTVDQPLTLGELIMRSTGTVNTLQVNEDMTAAKLTLDPSGGTYDGNRLWYKINVAADKTFRAGADATASFYFPVLGGSGTVVKEGTGTAFLHHLGAGAAFTFPGTFTVASGVVNLCYDENVGMYRVLDGGTLDMGGGAQWASPSKLNGSGYNGQGAVYFSQTNGLWPTATFSKPITLETTSTFNVDAARTITLSGAIDGDGGLTKIGGGKLIIDAACSYAGGTSLEAGKLQVNNSVLGDMTVGSATLALESDTALAEDCSLYLNAGATVDIADGKNIRVLALYLDGVKQSSGTWGGSGSGADHTDDTFFAGRTGMLTVGPAGPIITTFSVADRTSSSVLVTNEAEITLTLAAEAPEGTTLTGWLVTQSDVQPTDGWLLAAPVDYAITGDSGTVTLHAWAQDSAGGIGHATASIYFNTAAPIASSVVVTDNDDGTATATWTTDIPAEGSVKYGPVSLLGGTPNSASENALGTTHSVVLTGIAAGTNYKLILVNNEIASAPIYWPLAWPIEGDANQDCRVNILDLIFIRNKLNQPAGTGDNWKADVNEDTRINILDLIYVRNKLNTQCP